MARSSASIPPLPPDSPATADVMELTELEHGVIDIFVGMADILGVPKSVGEIYGLLFASARPLAFQDINEQLKMSKGSASQGLRLLRAVGAIKLVYVAGDRRDYFVPETELRTLLTGFLREKIRPHLESGALRIRVLEQLARSTALVGTEDLRVLRKRIEKLGSWQKKARAVLPLMTKLFG